MKRKNTDRQKRVMSYMGRVIWYYDGAFMVAKGDRTDAYFATVKDAMEWIDNKGNK